MAVAVLYALHGVWYFGSAYHSGRCGSQSARTFADALLSARRWKYSCRSNADKCHRRHTRRTNRGPRRKHRSRRHREFGSGFLAVGTQETGFDRPVKIWASLVADGKIVSRFEPLPEPTSATTPSLTRTPAGLALTYTRATADEGFGGSMRAYILPIGEQRRRSVGPN